MALFENTIIEGMSNHDQNNISGNAGIVGNKNVFVDKEGNSNKTPYDQLCTKIGQMRERFSVLTPEWNIIESINFKSHLFAGTDVKAKILLDYLNNMDKIVKEGEKIVGDIMDEIKKGALGEKKLTEEVKYLAQTTITSTHTSTENAIKNLIKNISAIIRE